MMTKIDLSGVWSFHTDEEKIGIEQKFFEQKKFDDTIKLPSTTSFAKKGRYNNERETGFLTDEYKYEGYAWFSKKVKLERAYRNKILKLFLERTRITSLWIDGEKVGSYDSLSTPHIYDITDFVKSGEFVITVMVDNTGYSTKGGHLTSPDTQTNWNGITGEISLRVYDKIYMDNIQIYGDISNNSARVRLRLNNTESADVSVKVFMGDNKLPLQKFTLNSDENGFCEFTYDMVEYPILWSEYQPCLYTMRIDLEVSQETEFVNFGMREFKADGMDFTINGEKVKLRGKHDGLIFPLTGFAPTTVDEWVRILKISKSYGINHYRFHTCCPPDAAFTAADMVGIYMSPELPFWGTITARDDEWHNETEQQYLIEEGRRMLETFGNHPSFTMMSLGNELWGSSERMGEILREYHKLDDRHLYTQGCNNFQFWPQIIPEDDFFVGVRLSKTRLIRGSYATCDAPLGHIQTDAPDTNHNYDAYIIPPKLDDDSVSGDTEIEIQYGTGVKKVKVSETAGGLVPTKPVVTHEIGQYAVYPDFNEIKKYTGSIKARNFEVFRERLEEKGMADLADKFFKASGRLSADCYKDEIETAMRSKYVAGFQLLDLQDFSGQGTALVGMLDAFMDSKGLITPEKWRGFCSDAVILAQFGKYVYESGEKFSAMVSLSYYRPVRLMNKQISWKLSCEDKKVAEGKLSIPNNTYGLCEIGSFNMNIPKFDNSRKLTLTLCIENTDIQNTYDLWVYPENPTVNLNGKAVNGDTVLHMTSDKAKALSLLNEGQRVLYIPEKIENSIQGFYCTDFWCYPMFRSISESMNKEVPVGTMGLLIDNAHPSLKSFKSDFYSTPQWYHIVSNSDCTILDATDSKFRPIVQMIDNFERNHKLGILYEAKIGEGKLLVCTARLNDSNICNLPEVKAFAKSIVEYGLSEEFNPQYSADTDIIM